LSDPFCRGAARLVASGLLTYLKKRCLTKSSDSKMSMVARKIKYTGEKVTNNKKSDTVINIAYSVYLVLLSIRY